MSDKAGSSDGSGWRWQIVGGVAAFIGLYGLWIALVGEWDSQDLVAGGCTAAVAVAIGWLTSQRGRALPAFRRGDARRVAALFPRYVTETARVFAVAARRAGRKGEAGRTVPVATDATGGGWPAARRSSVVGVLLSATPGTVLVDLDDDSGEALVHQLGGDRPTW